MTNITDNKVSAIEESTVKSHAKGKWHILKVTNQTIMSFFPGNKGSDSAEKSLSSYSVIEDKLSSSFCSNNKRIDSMAVSNENIKAEIMWLLKIVISNFSMNSCELLQIFLQNSSIVPLLMHSKWTFKIVGIWFAMALLRISTSCLWKNWIIHCLLTLPLTNALAKSIKSGRWFNCKMLMLYLQSNHH